MFICCSNHLYSMHWLFREEDTPSKKDAKEVLAIRSTKLTKEKVDRETRYIIYRNEYCYGHIGDQIANAIYDKQYTRLTPDGQYLITPNNFYNRVIVRNIVRKKERALPLSGKIHWLTVLQKKVKLKVLYHEGQVLSVSYDNSKTRIMIQVLLNALDFNKEQPIEEEEYLSRKTVSKKTQSL